MNTNMQAVGFKANSKLEAFINNKLKKLEKYDNSITGYDVFLNLDNANDKDNKVVEIKLTVPGAELFAKRSCKTFEEAADLVTEALKVQILKNKEKAKM